MLSWFWKRTDNVSKETAEYSDVPDTDITSMKNKDNGSNVEQVDLAGQFQSSETTVVTSIPHTSTSTTPTSPSPASRQNSIFSWFSRDKKDATQCTPSVTSASPNEQKKEFTSDSPNELHDTVSDVMILEKDEFVPDPKVVAFFQDFPDCYREKVIKRFSSRKGLFRYDMYRDWKMEEEMRAAMKGQWLEAQRERDALKRERYMEKFETHAEDTRKQREEEGVPEWEQFFLQYFPLQDGEYMLQKLALAVNLSAAGLCALHFGLTYKKRNPKKYLGVGKWRLITTGVAGTAACVCFQYFAVCRLYDWGYYDETFDKRPVLDKIVDKNTKDLEKAFEKFLDFMDPPQSKDKS